MEIESVNGIFGNFKPEINLITRPESFSRSYSGSSDVCIIYL